MGYPDFKNSIRDTTEHVPYDTGTAILASPLSKGRWDRCMKSLGDGARDIGLTISVWREVGPAQYKPFFISENSRLGLVWSVIMHRMKLFWKGNL